MPQARGPKLAVDDVPPSTSGAASSRVMIVPRSADRDLVRFAWGCLPQIVAGALSNQSKRTHRNDCFAPDIRLATVGSDQGLFLGRLFRR